MKRRPSEQIIESLEMFLVLFDVIRVMHSIVQVKIGPSHFLIEFIHRRCKILQLGIVVFEFALPVDREMTNFSRPVELSKG